MVPENYHHHGRRKGNIRGLRRTRGHSRCEKEQQDRGQGGEVASGRGYGTSLGRVVESEVGTKDGFDMPDRRRGWGPDKEI